MPFFSRLTPLFFFSVLACALTVDGATIQRQLTDGLRLRQSQLGSMRWRFTERDYPELQPSKILMDITVDVAVLGHSLREDVVTRPLPKELSDRVAHAAWNGELFTSFLETHFQDGRRTFSGVINASCNTCLARTYWLTAIEQNLFTEPRDLLSVVSLPQAVVTDVTEHGVNLVDCKIELPDEHCTIEARFDPANDWIPVFIKQVYNNPKLDLIEMEYNARETTKSNVVVPKKATIRVYNRNVEAEIGYNGPCISEITFEAVAPDSTLTAQYFTLKLPRGTEAFDQVDNISFIAGKAVVVVDDDGLHYHTSQKYFPKLNQYVDYESGLTDQEWEQSDAKKMVDDTWAELSGGKVIPKGQGAAPIANAVPAGQARTSLSWLAGAALLITLGVALVLIGRHNINNSRPRAN